MDQSFGQHPSLGTHAVDAVEGVPEAALADAGDAAQPRNGDWPVKMGPNVCLGAFDDRPARCRPPDIPGPWLRNDWHGAHGTAEVPPKELGDLSDSAVNFDRWGPETFTGTLVSAMMQTY